MNAEQIQIPPELITRAIAAGLIRGRCWWSRSRESLVARADDGRWWWAPESWTWGQVVRHAPRFDTEIEALTAAVEWIEAGEPEVPHG